MAEQASLFETVNGRVVIHGGIRLVQNFASHRETESCTKLFQGKLTDSQFEDMEDIARKEGFDKMSTFIREFMVPVFLQVYPHWKKMKSNWDLVVNLVTRLS